MCMLKGAPAANSHELPGMMGQTSLTGPKVNICQEPNVCKIGFAINTFYWISVNAYFVLSNFLWFYLTKITLIYKFASLYLMLFCFIKKLCYK